MSTSPPSAPSSDFPVRLGEELAHWEREGLVTSDQAAALRARYGLLGAETPRSLHQSRLVSLLSVLGAVLVGVGVILLVGANWEELPRWFRLFLLVGSTAAAYGFGYRLTYGAKRSPKLEMALLLLGSLLWGAGIFLIWQTFHISGSQPGPGGEAVALLYWYLGVLPLAYVLRSPLHLTLSLIVASVWLGMVLAEWPDLRASTALAVLLGTGVLLYALGRLHEGPVGLRSLEIPYRWLGLWYLFGALYVFSYRMFWQELPSGHAAPPLLVPGILLALAGGSALVLLFRDGNRSRAALAEAASLLTLVALGWAVAAVPEVFHVSGDPFSPATGEALAVMAVFNLLLLAAEVGLVALGWARRQPGLMNFGLFVFFLQVVTRYFDLLGGLLSGGLLFIGAGLLLVLLGIAVERSRRSLLRSMQERRTS